jgi:GalNAc-alpha-(1->4)-GalNAc-alpha-(1->3)-diNAcBac-PP-undecaprenol alpha-1,4-N-acetyl-D-galactosaminyltransferase
MVKICFIIPSLNAGGMERVMAELITQFSQKDNVELHLVLFGRKRELFYKLPKNITIHRPNFEFNNKFRFFSTCMTICALRIMVTNIRPTSILSFGELWNSFVLIALLGKDYPIYVSDRCQPNKSLGKVHDYLRKVLYPKATGIIAQTEIAKSIYLKQFKHNNIKVIGNPIRIIDKLENITKENIVLSVGRLITTKHHDELIKMFVRINNPDWKLIIVGGDAIKQNNMLKLKALIKELNAENQIILAGKQREVDSYYLKSKIFAFTSSSEGFPNVIGEAQSAGLPVIAFDCIAGPADLIENNKNGYLIPLFDYKQFEEKLSQLMVNSSLVGLMGSFAQKSIKQFDAYSISEKFYEYITEDNQTIIRTNTL